MELDLSQCYDPSFLQCIMENRVNKNIEASMGTQSNRSIEQESISEAIRFFGLRTLQPQEENYTQSHRRRLTPEEYANYEEYLRETAISTTVFSYGLTLPD